MYLPVILMSSMAISPLFPPTVASSSTLKVPILAGIGNEANFHCVPEQESCGYHGVVRHVQPTGKPYFEATARRGVVISRHATDVAAARVVAKKRRVSVESLKKKQPLTKKLATTLFKSSYVVFRSYVPGDLDNLLRLEKANAKIYSQEL